MDNPHRLPTVPLAATSHEIPWAQKTFGDSQNGVYAGFTYTYLFLRDKDCRIEYKGG